eukprot:scaffold36362_cov64-Phaeocystis_antarctica.AAC.6
MIDDEQFSTHTRAKASVLHADATEQATPLNFGDGRRLALGTQPGNDQSEDGEGSHEEAVPV